MHIVFAHVLGIAAIFSVAFLLWSLFFTSSADSDNYDPWNDEDWDSEDDHKSN